MSCNAGDDLVGEKVSPNMLFLVWSSVKDTKLQLSCIHVFLLVLFRGFFHASTFQVLSRLHLHTFIISQVQDQQLKCYNYNGLIK